ncbi:MAG: hypothetical protein AB7V48_05365 [Sedimentibacter sp.]
MQRYAEGKSRDLVQILGIHLPLEEYNDIQEVKASNNAMYLYSDKFMKKALAASILNIINFVICNLNRKEKKLCLVELEPEMGQ